MNPYKPYLDELFDRILELRHTTSMINSTLNSSIKAFADYQGNFISGSALVISDWSGPTDNGWEINFHTGFRKITLKDNYENEVNRINSQECCYAFGQSFEALERFFKDCAMYKLPTSPKCRFWIKKDSSKNIKRENLNGDKLFRIIKQAGDPYFSEYSSNNNKNLKFKELWSILSECRHAIVHSKSIIHIKKIKKNRLSF